MKKLLLFSILSLSFLVLACESSMATIYWNPENQEGELTELILVSKQKTKGPFFGFIEVDGVQQGNPWSFYKADPYQSQPKIERGKITQRIQIAPNREYKLVLAPFKVQTFEDQLYMKRGAMDRDNTVEITLPPLETETSYQLIISEASFFPDPEKVALLSLYKSDATLFTPNTLIRQWQIVGESDKALFNPKVTNYKVLKK